MTTKAFKHKIEDIFYLQVRSYVGEILNFNSANMTSLGLFLHLPITISLNKMKQLPTKESSCIDKNLLEFLNYFSAYSTLEDGKVVVKFSFIYGKIEDLDYLTRSMELRIVREYLSFVYLKELQHILRKHYLKPTRDILKLIADRYFLDHTEHHLSDNIEDLIALSFEYAVNYSLIDIVQNDEFKKVLTSTVFYKKKYAEMQMSEISILQDLLKNLEDITVEDTQKTGNKTDAKIENKIISDSSITASKHKIQADTIYDGTKSIEELLSVENGVSSLADVLSDFISEHQKGDESQNIIQKLGMPRRVKSDWVKEVINRLLVITRDITHQYTSSWSSLKNNYRKIGLFPTKKYLKKTTFLYISIDQSGSMSDSELQKINYILSILAKKVSYMKILIHDAIIVKEFEFGTKSGYEYKIKLDEMLYNRYASGGTSHQDIFRYLDANIKTKDTGESIYISFSDNDSDIEEYYFEYKIIRKIRKFWITTEYKLDEKIQGKQVVMR